VVGAKAAAAKVTKQFLRHVAYGGIASGQAKSGDVAGAKATAAAIREAAEDAGRIYWKQWVFADIASTQAAAGDIEGAKISAAEAGKPWKPLAYCCITESQAERGNIAGAKVTAAGIDDEFGAYYKMLAYFAIAKACMKAGDKAAARQAVDLAEAVVARANDKEWKRERYCDIVNAREDAGDVAGARAMAARLGHWSRVAELEAKDGSPAAARKTLGRAVEAAAARDDSERDGVYLDIAKDQAKFGDLIGAKNTAARIRDAQWRAQAQHSIIAAHAVAGDMEAARAYAATLRYGPFARCVLFCDAARELCSVE
jgi:hypothetical protein